MKLLQKLILRFQKLFGIGNRGAASNRTLMLEPTWSITVSNKRKLPPSDLRHPDHALWKRWRADVAMDTPADAVLRKQLEEDAKAASLPRKLMLEPKWSLCKAGSVRLLPSDPRHVDHELWQRWQHDLLLDTPEERERRNKEEIEANFTDEMYSASIIDDVPSSETVNVRRPDPIETELNDAEKARIADEQRRRREQYAQLRDTRRSEEQIRFSDEQRMRDILIHQKRKEEAEEAAARERENENLFRDSVTSGVLASERRDDGWNGQGIMPALISSVPSTEKA